MVIKWKGSGAFGEIHLIAGYGSSNEAAILWS
jgi:hypothetical protein